MAISITARKFAKLATMTSWAKNILRSESVKVHQGIKIHDGTKTRLVCLVFTDCINMRWHTRKAMGSLERVKVTPGHVGIMISRIWDVQVLPQPIALMDHCSMISLHSMLSRNPMLLDKTSISVCISDYGKLATQARCTRSPGRS